MSVTAKLNAALSPLALGKAWPAINLAQPAVLPYIVFTCVAHDPNTKLEGACALQYTRVQVDAYSKRALEAEALGKTIESTMQAAPISGTPLPGLGGPLYDNETQLYRMSADYGIWSSD